MRSESSAAALAAVVLCVAACSSPSPSPPPSPAATPQPRSLEPVSGTVAESTVTTSATVEKIDPMTRRVLLRDAAGKSVEMRVPADIRNLEQVKVGDEVVVSYYESLAYEVKKPGSATTGASVNSLVRRADADAPGARAAQIRTVTVVIEAIDMARPSVTLRGTDGKLVTVAVKDRSKLERVAVGDLVELTYTEALMASVQPKR